jgi:predicted butyrate kinase (DUF1464 family)
MDTRNITREQAVGVTMFYQSLLRLGGWQIVIDMVRPRNQDNRESNGDMWYRTPSRKVRLRPVDPNEVGESRRGEMDMEYIIVHELLHLHIAPMWEIVKQVTDGMSDEVRRTIRSLFEDAEEQACTAIGEAIVALRRGDAVMAFVDGAVDLGNSKIPPPVE